MNLRLSDGQVDKIFKFTSPKKFLISILKKGIFYYASKINQWAFILLLLAKKEYFGIEQENVRPKIGALSKGRKKQFHIF